MPKSPIRVVTVIMAFKHKNEEEIRLRLNWLQTDSRNDFSENGGVWLLLQIRSKLKSISSWPNLRAKTTEMIFHFYFHFKLLPALENRRERERGRKKESIATSSASAVAPIAIDASIFARCVNLHAITIARSADRSNCDRADRDLAFVCSNLMIFFWVLFVFWGMNDIIYSFGNRENVWKYE